MKNLIYHCPFCNYKYKNKQALYNHMNNIHKDQLENKSPSQVYFNYKYHKTSGKCIICGKSTEWDESVERYERICHRNNDKCKKIYRNMFKKRMMKTYGKTTLLNDPNFQKKMLKGRKISGTYTWSDKSKKFDYVGKYELNLLMFLDLMMHFPSTAIISPAPQIFNYKYKNKTHFYIPDLYITPCNLIIEVKSFENKHYRLRDIDQEKAKDQVVLKSNFNYIKVHDNEFDELFNWFLNYKNSI